MLTVVGRCDTAQATMNNHIGGFMTGTQPDTSTAVLVEPNRLSREGMARLLSECGFVIEAGYPDLSGLLSNVASKSRAPDFCVLDSAALTDSAKSDLIQLREHLPSTQIVVFIEGSDPKVALSCLLAGADGCLIKDMSTEAMVNTLRLSELGERVFPARVITSLLYKPEMQRPLADGIPVDTDLCDPEECHLSEREMEILSALAEGHANKEIGFQTGLSESTVKVHLRNILRKLGASNRTQAAIWALRNGIFGHHRARYPDTAECPGDGLSRPSPNIAEAPFVSERG